jgi:ribonuclease BN (tRNA processing enzyme)
MKIRVLGCSSAIGGDARTSSYLIDDDILVDAGTGVGNLDIEALKKIDHVFLTHSHLDHIACLPLISDSVGALRDKPVTIHARPQTLELLRKHIFNWQIWPDFTVVPSEEAPFMTMEEFTPGDLWESNGRQIRSVSVNHTVPAVGYLVGNGNQVLALSGDTTVTNDFWQAINESKNPRYLILETTFPDAQVELATVSKHLCPSMVQGELKKLQGKPEVFITHMMPGDEVTIMAELRERLPEFTLNRLEPNQVFELN